MIGDYLVVSWPVSINGIARTSEGSESIDIKSTDWGRLLYQLEEEIPETLPRFHGVGLM